MKRRIDHIIGIISAALLAGVSFQSCAADDAGEPQAGTIAVNTLAVDDTRAGSAQGDNTFMVLFWQQMAHLGPDGGFSSTPWLAPYLAGHAPQPVAFYKNSVFDTHYPYPAPDDSYLYATGYAPGNVLKPDGTGLGYRRLAATVDHTKKGRYDFLGCDFWPEVFRGSLKDPFAQDKNKLYFRHLGAKLVFYADRDGKTMENKQFVRNVQIKNLRMSIDGGQEWTSMFTPSEFEWDAFEREDASSAPADFTDSYKKVIAAVKLIEGNEGAADSYPAAGYRTAEAESFAGADSDFVLQKGNSDRVPVDGMVIDSCYVCNPIENGEPRTGQAIRLRMDISAELSFDPNFSEGTGSGSTASDLTFTREWLDRELTIYQVEVGADGKAKPTAQTVRMFKPGNEYRVYIRFYRTGVNLAAQELPWNFGGSHYINISDGDAQDPTEEK